MACSIALGWFHSMNPIRIGDDVISATNLVLRSRAKHGVSKDGAGTISPVAVLRDARESALLRMRMMIST
jgi:hypothetical protein